MSYDQPIHPWEREDEEIRKAFAEKDAIIETMNEAHKLLIAQKNRLITQLADALETTKESGSSRDDWRALVEKLVQRARKATK